MPSYCTIFFQPREKQTEIDQLQYELATQSRRHANEVSTLRQRIAELELNVAETRREADEYFKGGLQTNLEATALGNQVKCSSRKWQLWICISFLRWFPCLLYKGFSCDVISSLFCKSSHFRPPCWFPLPVVWYWKNNKTSPRSFYLDYVIIPNCTKVTWI